MTFYTDFIKKPARIIAAALCALTLLSALPAGASDEVVYVAGNPDLYPVEYYDLDRKCFAGILPRVMELVSLETGLTFHYINEGTADSHRRIAKNRQAELLTAYVPDPDTEEYLSGSVTLMTVPLKGKDTDVCIAYTAIADEELQAEINDALSSLSQTELAEIVIAFTIGREAPRDRIVPLVLMGAALLLALAAIALILILQLRKKRRETADRLVDPLTGLGSTAYFEKYYNSFINDHNRSLYYVLYASFDIHRVTQYLGSEAADSALREAAAIIRDHARDTDIPARVSEGGFGLAYLCSSRDEAGQYTLELLARLNAELDDFSAEFHGGIYPLGISSCRWDTALANAELGCRRAARERLPYVFSTQEVLSDAETLQKLQEQTGAAVQNREFLPYLQMTVSAETGMIAGAELLSRWQNPDYGLLTPGRYISIMEDAGTIVELDLYMFEEACKYLVRSVRQGRGDFYISCNFSRLTMSHPDFTERLFAIASRYDFPRELFVIEITEDILETNKEKALKNATECKEFGFRLALDDMGSGYTSFSNLCEYPIDVVKLDRSVIVGSVEKERGAIMVDAIVAMAHHMGMLVVCEGVETDEQDALVRKAGTDLIQGFRYSRVIPMEEADRFIRRYTETAAAQRAARSAEEKAPAEEMTPAKEPAPLSAQRAARASAQRAAAQKAALRKKKEPQAGKAPAPPAPTKPGTAPPSAEPSMKEKLSCIFTKHIFTPRR